MNSPRGARWPALVVAAAAASVAVTGAGCGDGEDVCRGAVEVGAELNLIAMRKADGSLWTWGQRPRDHGTRTGVRTAPEREALDATRTRFVDGGLCLRQAAGDVQCPFFADTLTPPFAFPSYAREAAFWLSAATYQQQRPPPSICALGAEGGLTCRWGWADPTYTTRGPGVARMSLGADHLCTLGQDGTVSCESGGPDLPPGLVEVWRRPPVEVTAAVQIVSTDLAACARTAAGEVWCWGSYDYQARWPLAEPTPVAGIGGPAVALVAGQQHVCALRADGAVACWGDHALIVSGAGDTFTTAQPVTTLPRPAISLASAGATVCAVLDDGTVWCWGDNQYGQLGDGTALLGNAAVTRVPSREAPAPVVSCD